MTSTPVTSPTATTTNDAALNAGGILTIDLDAVAANWRQLRDRVGPASCAAAVKADAYGLGAARVGPALAVAGCTTFFVALPDEAVALRAAVPAADIYVLGGLFPGSAELFRTHAIRPVLNHLGEIAAWQGNARKAESSLPAAVHIDTGMNRLGLGPDELDRLAGQPALLDGLDVCLWMTHLVAAESDPVVTARQLGRFRTALGRLPAAPASLTNSSGIFLGPAFHFDMARPGAALYGINPTPGQRNPMHDTVTLMVRILQVRDVDSPMTVGYGATHRVAGRGKIATIAVGYADGYARSLSARGHVFVDGVPAPVVGRVSMDLITVDVSALPAVEPGRFVELIGPNRPVDTVASEAGTIGYEVMTALGRRYHRVYTGGVA